MQGGTRGPRPTRSTHPAHAGFDEPGSRLLKGGSAPPISWTCPVETQILEQRRVFQIGQATVVGAGAVIAVLPPGLDPSPYGGDLAAWLIDPNIYDPLKRLIVSTAPDLNNTKTIGLHYCDAAKQNSAIDAVDLVRLARDASSAATRT